MVLIQLAIDDQGQLVGNTKNIKNSLYHQMLGLWQDMLKDGSITQVRCIQLQK